MKNNKRSAFFSIVKGLALLVLAVQVIVACGKETMEDQPATNVDYHQTAKTQFVEADGAKYAYRVLGNKSGTPLIFVSPLSGSMDDWDPAVTNGLAQQYKVILFDNKGVGASTGQTANNIADMAKDAVTFIKALGYNKVNLLGFSMGSFITQQIALTEPGLVNKIILTGTGPKGAEGLSKVPEILGSIGNLPPQEQFLQFACAQTDKSRELGKLAYERIHKRIADRDPGSSQESGGAQLAAVLGWAQPNTNALDELKAVTQPVLIVQGKEDIFVPVVNASNMAEYLPNVSLKIYEDAGHGALFLYADQFVKDTQNFLGR